MTTVRPTAVRYEIDEPEPPASAMDPQSTASQMVTMTPWTTTVLTETPCLLVLAKLRGMMPSFAVSSSARDGPTIQEEISARTPAASRNAITYTSHPQWKCASNMLANATTTPVERLASSCASVMVMATARPPSVSSTMVRMQSTIMTIG